MTRIQSLIFSWTCPPHLSAPFTASGSARARRFRKPGPLCMSNSRVVTEHQEGNKESRKTVKGKRIKKAYHMEASNKPWQHVARDSVMHLIKYIYEHQILFFSSKATTFWFTKKEHLPRVTVFLSLCQKGMLFCSFLNVG